MRKIEQVNEFLSQQVDEKADFEDTIHKLESIFED